MTTRGVAPWLLTAALIACGRDLAIPEPEGGGGAGGSSVLPSGGQGATSPSSTTSSGSSSGGGSEGGGSSTGGSGTGGEAPRICPAAFECGQCVSVACPEVWCGCSDNPDCGALFGCTQTCNGDEACVQTCLSTFPDGIADAVLVTGCATDPCGASCPMAMNEVTPCEACFYSSCEPEMNACVAEPACTTLWSCLVACPNLDLTCQDDCYDASPSGVPLLESALACGVPACADLCPKE